MILIALLKGIAIGFLLAVPVGPIGVLCIRRTLAEGRRSALSTMLGAASADMIYGAVAAFGVTLISSFITEYFEAIRVIGGVILLYLGYRTYRAHISEEPPKLTMNHHAGNFISTMLLTLTNPLTLFAFAAVFAGVNTVEETGRTLTALLLVGGVFLGSLLWFTSLTLATYAFRNVLQKKGLDIINKGAGGFIMVAGAYALLSVVL
ncbi:MAG: LysE family transporter [Synechococcaceae cyanobacterium]|nr:LysE family transporter [Synechococcaceae cyanobacterium]